MLKCTSGGLGRGRLRRAINSINIICKELLILRDAKTFSRLLFAFSKIGIGLNTTLRANA